jgi:hypothetical protein
MLAIMFMHLPRDGNGAQSVSGPAARSKPTSIGRARSTERRRAVIDSLSTRSSGKPSSATSSPRTAWPSRRGSRASGVDRNIRARKLTAWARTDSGHPLDALPHTLPDPYAATVPAAGFARVETASRRNLTRVAEQGRFGFTLEHPTAAAAAAGPAVRVVRSRRHGATAALGRVVRGRANRSVPRICATIWS